MVKSNSILWVILLFLGVVFATALIILKEVWLPVNGGEFSFKNFIIYNFTVKIIGYVFKFLMVYLFFKLVFLVFDLDKKLPLLKLLLLAEIVYILVVKGYLFVYFSIIDSNITADFVNTYEANTSLISIVPDRFYSFEYVIGFANIFDLVYILFFVYMVAEELKISFWKSFKINGLSYLVLLLFFGVVKTFMSL